VTLKEAEAATGIPTNTLRKWVRKSGLASYLESDGELQVRMVDLGAVRERARALGRHLTPPPLERGDEAQHTGIAGAEASIADDEAPWVATDTLPSGPGGPDRATAEPPTGTMIVPVDAWNKMLTQLGNLHEAGQQLAEARERAAKAETEAAFLRERLAEMRAGTRPEAGAPDGTDRSDDAATAGGDGEHRPAPDRPGGTPSDPADAAERTTTYWRYLTTGWRQRKGRGDRD
jgi:hypothetical protein